MSQPTWILRRELSSFVRAVPTVKHLFIPQTFYKMKESVPTQQHCMFFLLYGSLVLSAFVAVSMVKVRNPERGPREGENDFKGREVGRVIGHICYASTSGVLGWGGLKWIRGQGDQVGRVSAKTEYIC